jgi:hypothetical protein
MHHELKTWPVYFSDVWNGKKLFECRLNDRNYQPGDTVTLKEFTLQGCYTGREVVACITYILHDDFKGLADGFCVFGFTITRKLRDGIEPIVRELDTQTFDNE